MEFPRQMYLGAARVEGQRGIGVTNPVSKDHVATDAAAGLRYGEVRINGVKCDLVRPHGGIGQSGIGQDCSHTALRDYLVPKRITCALDAGRAA